MTSAKKVFNKDLKLHDKSKNAGIHLDTQTEKTPVMIDWITASIQPKDYENRFHFFDTGVFQEISPQGELLKQFASRIFHKGSHDSNLGFRAPYPYQLEMSGNPVKFFQGHNLFGSDDYLGLFFEAGLAGRRSGEVQFPGEMTYLKNGFDQPRFTRLDLTRSYRFNSNEEARAWLKGVGGSARARSGSALLNENTVYFGKHSTRWSLKMYQKFDEINSKKKGHSLSEKLGSKDSRKLNEWVEGIMRVELTLRRPELEKFPKGFNLLEIFNEYYSRIQFNNNAEVLNMDKVLSNAKLTPAKKAVVQSWAMGSDIRLLYTEKAFYKVRREILNLCGLDIASPFIKSNEVLLTTALEIDKWDPEPIEALIFRPSEKTKRAYGVK